MTTSDSSVTYGDNFFVGRSREMNHLLNLLEKVISDEGQMVMLVGEPGIGKTRTAEEFAKLAEGQDVEVLWGRCYEGEGAPLYWPWMEVIRAYLDNHNTEEVRKYMKSGAAAIAEMVPRVAEDLGQIPQKKDQDDPVSARFRMFDSMTTFLKNATSSRPTVIILDDLHWADGPTLLLLEFLAHRLSETKLLVLGTYRDVEVRRTHPLQQTLGDLTRERLYEKLTLRGLDSEAVRHYVQVAAGEVESDALSEKVFAQSEGNPLFMSETVRLLADEWDIASTTVQIPDGIRAVLGRRLNRLSEACNRVLSTASVIGREFNLKILSALMEDMSEDQLLEILEEAMGARVVEELTEVYGRYRFNHAVTQQTLTEELSMTRRTRLHARIAVAMEHAYETEAETHAIEMVEHFANAETVLGSQRLSPYLLLAGQQALDRYAYEQAIDYFRRGLETKGEATEDGETADLYFGLGRAQAAMLDNGSFESLRKAFSIYESRDNHERMVAVLITIQFGHGLTDEAAQWVEVSCERCMDLVPESSPEAGYLLTSLPIARFRHNGNYDRALKTFTQAMEIAHINSEPRIELRALGNLGLVAWFDLRNEEARDFGLRALEIARKLGDMRSEARALRMLASASARMGDPSDVEYVNQEIEIAERLRDRSYLGAAYNRAGLVALNRAEFAKAADLFKRIIQIVDPAGGAEASVEGRLATIAYETGELEEGHRIVKRTMANIGDERLSPWTMGGIGLLAYKSDDPRLLEIMGSYSQHEFHKFSRAAEIEDADWRARGWLAAATNDAGAAAELFRAADKSPGYGLLRRVLIAVLARTAGNLDEANELFEELHPILEAAGQILWAQWNAFWWAGTLLMRAAPGDEARARDLLVETTSAASQYDLVLLEKRSRELIESIQKRPGEAGKKVYPDGLSQREVEVLSLVATGMTNKAIGERLFISVKTVHTHVGNIFQKAGLSNRAEATAYAIRNGISDQKQAESMHR